MAQDQVAKGKGFLRASCLQGLWWDQALAALLLLSACTGESGPDRVAGQFMDQYYVSADLNRAKALTTGLAAEKIAKEIELTAGAVSDAQTRSREISYILVERKEEGNRAFFAYDVKIAPQGGSSFTKRSLLSLGQVEGAWKITNFRDFDL